MEPRYLIDKILRDRPHMAEKMVPNPPGKEKMSEVIVEYARPLMEAAQTVEEQNKAITMAIICWNISIIDIEERDLRITETFAEAGETLDPATKEVIEFMLNRKDDLFRDNKRIVEDWIVKDRGSQLWFEVATRPFEPPICPRHSS